jgi:hypothetical protein
MNTYKVCAYKQLAHPYLIRAANEAEALAEFEKDVAEVEYLESITSADQPLVLHVQKVNP